MPKEKTQHETILHQPYPQSDDFFDKLSTQTSLSANEEAGGGSAKKPKENAKNFVNDPVSTENVLKSLMKYHKASIESARKKSLQVVEEIQKSNMAYAQKDQENILLKNRVIEMKQEAEEAKKQIKELNQENEKLKRKCSEEQFRYTKLEAGYDDNLYRLNEQLSNQQTIIEAHNNANKNLQEQLKKAEEQLQLVNAQWETVVRNKENERIELQQKYAELETQKDQMEPVFEQQKLQMENKFEALLQLKETELSQLQAEMQQQVASCGQLIDKNSDNRQMIAKLETLMLQRENEIVDLQLKHTLLEKQADLLKKALEEEKLQFAKKLEALSELQENELLRLQAEIQQHIAAYDQQIEENSRRKEIMDKLETLVRDKENQIVELQTKEIQIEKHTEVMSTVFKDEKQQLIQKLESLVQLKEKEQAELNQKIADNAQKLEAALKMLQESEQNCLQLQGRNDQLSNDAFTTVLQFESTINQKQAMIDKLDARVESFNEREKDNKIEIIELKAVNEKLTLEKAQHDAEQESQIIDLKKNIISMEKQHLSNIEILSDEMKELKQQLEAYKKEQEKKMAEYQAMLRQKEVDVTTCRQDYADLEREKNSEIAVLNYKINQIGNVFSQPVRRATPLKATSDRGSIKSPSPAESQNVIRSQSNSPDGAAAKVDNNKTQLEKIPITPPLSTNVGLAARTIRQRQLIKRPIYHQSHTSDFNSDTDDNGANSDWEKEHKKLINKNSRIKRVRHISPQRIENIFDQLKKSSNA